MNTQNTLLTLVFLILAACAKSETKPAASQFDPSTQTFNFQPVQAEPNANLSCLEQHPYLEDASWTGLCGYIDSSYCQSFAAANAQNKALYAACAGAQATPADLDLGNPRLCNKSFGCASACYNAHQTQTISGCALSVTCVTNAYHAQISGLALQACLFSEI